MTTLLEIKKFSSISLADPFFDSLKKDYNGFEDWFKGKANKDDSAFVLYDKNNNLQGFLYLKDESEEIDETIVPPMKKKKKIKGGYFQNRCS